MHGRWRLLLVAGLLVGVATAGVTFWATTLISRESRVGTTSPKPSPCTLDASGFLPASALPGFTQMLDQHLSAAPIKGGVPGAAQGLAVTDFSVGRVVGYLSDEAIDGPDRAQEDAYARSLGYPTGRIPLVPLSGPIVRDSPGLLEVYESVLVYHSDSGAEAFVKWLTQSLAASGASLWPASANDNKPLYFLPAQRAGSNPPYEQGFDYIAQSGPVVLRLALSGGQQLDASQVAQLAARAQKVLTNRVCNLGR